METGTRLFLACVIFVSFGCGGGNDDPDNGIGGDSGADTTVASDTAVTDTLHEVGQQDVDGDIEGKDSSGRDLGADGEDPLEPCRPGESCDDHDPCTIDDLCNEDETCEGTPVEDCDDGIDCTFDECTTETDCTHEVKPGWCFVDDKCIEDGEGDLVTACYSCQTAIANDRLLPDDTLSCDDGDPCTASDHCHEGFCVSSAKDCQDGNPCTADMCDAGNCVHENVEGMCDDDDLCTENDLCVEGECQGSPIGCWDQNPCTQDACHPDFGCVHEFLDIPCDDGNICSVGDRCWSGMCVSGEDRLDCDDDNECTDDGCVPTREDGCVHIPNVAPCDDGDPCTLEDSCKAGICNPGSAILDCDDGNVCTDDVCTPGVGCEYLNNTAPCDDNEPCSLDDVCRDGECSPGETPLVCDDGNECTTDYCETGIGCVYENNLNECDDNNVCTVGDVCGDGECIGSPLVGMCDDDDPCTLDYCLPTGDAPGCYHNPKPECRPQIVIDYPPRASTMGKVSSDTITILGHIEYPDVAIGEDGYPSPEMAVGFVTVNGLDVMVDPTDNKWTFDATMTMQQGMNPIVAYGQAAVAGYQDYVVQSVYYSDKWFTVSHANPGAGMVSDGVKIFLGKTVWDDNDTSTPDDIATLLTNILKTLDLSTLISNPVTKGDFGWCDYKVNLKNMRYGTPSLDLIPDTGKIKIKVVIPNFSVKVDVPISGFGCPDFSGSAKASSITINANLNLSISAAGEPVATVTNPNVVVSGLDIDIDGVWGFLFNWIIDFFEDDFAGMIEDAFEEQLAGQLSDLVQGAVADLALEPEFEVPALMPGMQPVTLQMKSKFSTISLTPAGSDIGLAAVVLPDAGQTPPQPIRGSIGRGGCLGTDVGEPTLPHTYEMGLLAKDDFLNEALYAVWASNTLVIPVGPEMLGDIDLTTYGIANLALQVEFMLPPLISDCNVEHKMFFEAGDVKISASMKLFGSQVQMTMYTSLIAEARIVLVEGVTGTEVGIQIETPLFIDIEVAQIDGGLVGAEDTISSLMRTVALPMVLDMLSGDTLASFELPSIDLSSLAEGFPAGSVIEIDMKEVQRSKGATVVLGNVK